MHCFVQTYPGGNADMKNHAPYFRRAGFEKVVVVGTEGGNCYRPADFDYVEIGRNSYVDGDHLCRRLVDCVKYMLVGYRFDWLCACEYDVVFFKSFPALKLGFSGHRVGGQIAGCKSTFFCHWPVVADRESWMRWLHAADDLLAAGEIEIGTPDAFLALAVERAGIPVHFDVWKAYSRNTIHPPVFNLEARDAYRAGAIVMHGVKTAPQYGVPSGLEMLRFITT